ncbi:glycosyltransferase [Flavobacterium buctense]|uniref:Glycosyltransferase n=1 Tax=Flavobacterium buctense TaxID=1648146 RepID=A0ABU9E0Q0_9FLAO|nr:glycosyltransferase [Flavobacterium buctense]
MKSQDLDWKTETNKSPLVAIWMVTYNHEAYVVEAIDSVLMQQTHFDFKLYIGDDCSKDNTRKIIQEYKEKYPHKIELLLHEKNLGASPNGIFMYQHCIQTGAKYIALCEGDDYWTDPLKLQKQVDFLEVHKDCNVCFTRATMLKGSVLTLHEIPKPFSSVPFFYEELLRYYNFITTASVMFKNQKNLVIPEWITSLPFGDLGVYKVISQDKKIACIDEVMSVYRIHGEGIWSKVKPIEAEKKYLDFYKNMYVHLNKNEQSIVSQKIKKSLSNVSNYKYPSQKIARKLHLYFNLIKSFRYL